MTDLMKQPRDEHGQFVSLERFITALMDERERSHAREHQLIDKALETASGLREEAIAQARVVVNDRLEKLNELRAEVIKDRGLYITRTEFDLSISPLQEFRARAIGFGALVSLVSAVVGGGITALILGAF